MKKIMKLKILLPILAGAAVGVLLFMMGDADDAPGLSAIGLAIGFLLIMLGIYNAGVIKKGFLTPILLFCYGAGGICLSVAMLFDNEYKESPGIPYIGIALGFALIAIGTIRLRKIKIRRSR